MKSYFVTLYMDSGEKITAVINAEDEYELINIVNMEDMQDKDRPIPLNCRFKHLGDNVESVCYCVGHISSIHYKEM